MCLPSGQGPFCSPSLVTTLFFPPCSVLLFRSAETMFRRWEMSLHASEWMSLARAFFEKFSLSLLYLQESYQRSTNSYTLQYPAEHVPGLQKHDVSWLKYLKNTKANVFSFRLRSFSRKEKARSLPLYRSAKQQKKKHRIVTCLGWASIT